MDFVKAKGGPNSITIYYSSDNRLMIRSRGTEKIFEIYFIQNWN